MNINKIDSYFEANDNTILSKMKPLYGTDELLNCGTITFGDKVYLIDYKDKDKIINFNKNFIFNDYNNEDYPSYTYNYKRFNYLDFIFNYSQESACYNFKNSNKYDLRRSNVEIYHSYHKNIIEKYNVIKYIPGHYLTLGQDAGIMKNPLWKIKENDKEYILMYCEKDTICKLCDESYQKILDYEKILNKKISWFKLQNGYIMGSNDLYIHQIITGCYGNGKGTKTISVDHIDQDPLNNTIKNLRIATRKEQEANSKGIKEGTKRERKHNAKDLPEGVSQEMMKKYVVYYHEWLDKEHTKQREFFKVEKHPKLDKHWVTTKSGKVSIQDKLKEANKIVDDLENNIYPEKEEFQLPKYISLTTFREKPHLVFEKRIDGKRLNLKMVLPEEYDIQEQLEKFNDKIKQKYEGESIFEENKNPLKKFKYTLFITLDSVKKNVDKITFDISRYGNFTHTLELNEFVTEQFAVEKAEEWLSEKVTIDYFNSIKSDLFYKFDDINEELEYIKDKIKGDLLTDCKYLEEAKNYSTHLKITCGS